jgi:hypothetical protein
MCMCAGVDDKDHLIAEKSKWSSVVKGVDLSPAMFQVIQPTCESPRYFHECVASLLFFLNVHLSSCPFDGTALLIWRGAEDGE